MGKIKTNNVIEPAFAFDRQAAGFDARADPGASAAEAIAKALENLADGLPRVAPLLDVGAGTGAISRHLAQASRLYLGMDLSLGMLRRFQSRLPAAGALLLRADAGAHWPVASGGLGIIFLARVAHLLNEEHLLSECRRVALPGALVAFGSVSRQRDSLRSRMRRRMRELLEAEGLQGRSGRRSRRRLLTRLGDGGEVLPPVEAASWAVMERPAVSLAAWEGKNGLAGLPLPAAIRRKVLGQLADWARAELGGLDVERESRESFVLEGVLLGTT